MSRGLEVLRESGPRLLARKVFAELFYRRLVIYEARLDMPRSPVRCELPLRFDVLGPHQLADYLACQPEADPAALQRRMRLGDRCHTARLHDDVIAVRWVAFRDVRLTTAGTVLSIAERDVYLDGAYTAPRWRRQGVAAALTADLLDRLELDGYCRALSGWIPENVAARSLHPARGPRVAVLPVIRVGPWSHQLKPRAAAARARFVEPAREGRATFATPDRPAS